MTSEIASQIAQDFSDTIRRKVYNQTFMHCILSGKSKEEAVKIATKELEDFDNGTKQQ